MNSLTVSARPTLPASGHGCLPANPTTVGLDEVVMTDFIVDRAMMAGEKGETVSLDGQFGGRQVGIEIIPRTASQANELIKKSGARDSRPSLSEAEQTFLAMLQSMGKKANNAHSFVQVCGVAGNIGMALLLAFQNTRRGALINIDGRYTPDARNHEAVSEVDGYRSPPGEKKEDRQLYFSHFCINTSAQSGTLPKNCTPPVPAAESYDRYTVDEGWLHGPRIVEARPYASMSLWSANDPTLPRYTRFALKSSETMFPLDNYQALAGGGAHMVSTPQANGILHEGEVNGMTFHITETTKPAPCGQIGSST